MRVAAGMRALAVNFPKTVRTNDFWRKHHPEMVRDAEERANAQVWAPPSTKTRGDLFLQEMAPFLKDPFRGAVERRVLAEGETVLSLELGAARAALHAASLGVDDVDIMLVSSFLGDHIGIGNGAWLARELGVKSAAWNIETACVGALASFELACGLVGSGQARNVLVVASCTYSRVVEPTETLSWHVGDGACAFVVSPTTGKRGLLGAKNINTSETCGAIRYELAPNPTEQSAIRMKNTKDAGTVLIDTAVDFVQTCCRGAAESAGVSLDDIQHFVFNTPTAWYMRFCARALGIDPERSVNTYARYANMGPMLMPANLYALASTERIEPDDLVMLYSVGSVSSAGAVVVRWGEMELGGEA
jgi:3-oxoacyl-[acyl-carrier-protein] synthase-3